MLAIFSYIEVEMSVDPFIGRFSEIAINGFGMLFFSIRILEIIVFYKKTQN